MSTSSGRNSGLLSLSSSNAGKEQWWERRRNVRGEKHTRGNILIDMSIPFIWGFYRGPLFSHLRRPPSTYHILLDSGLDKGQTTRIHTHAHIYVVQYILLLTAGISAFPSFISTIPKTFSTTQRGNQYSTNHFLHFHLKLLFYFFLRQNITISSNKVTRYVLLYPFLAISFSFL
jgi:hypothetical protein